jgi:hypothetical protein
VISIRNIVVLALMQAGVIVVGVLAAGLCHRVYTSNGMEVPGPVAALYNFGVIGLLIPLAWVTGAVSLQLRATVSDNAKVLVFWTGILILVVLVVFVIWTDVPLLIRALMTMVHTRGDEGGGG